MQNEIRELLRPELRDLVPYHVPAYKGVIKLDANENNFEFPPVAAADIAKRMRSEIYNRYPDSEARNLRQALASRHGVDIGQVMVGNGSDELILDLMLAFAAGAKVLIAVPTFSMYAIHAVIAGAKPVPVARRENFDLNVEALVAAAADPDVKMIVLCTPNNPTGNVIPLEQLETVLRESRAMVVVDEAYIDFGGVSALPLVARYPGLVLLRTFSKAFALAGLRVGYLLAQAQTIEALWRVKQPFNVNSFSQLAAETVLAHRAEFEERIALIVKERERLYAALRAIPGVEAYPSEANFILFRTPLSGGKIYEELLARGVLIRKLDDPRLERCLRVSVGKPRENDLFLAALDDVLRIFK
ncbi:MAG: histidinol-phosphate transaminase [Bacillota bacterium]